MSAPQRSRLVVITGLGTTQILGYGTSFYFPAVLAAPIIADTGWSLGWVVGGVSIGLLVAGLVSPAVGRLVDRWGGRPVLATSPVLYAIGLTGIGLAPNLLAYLLAWIVVGAGMGTGLYDAVFAALGRLYGRDARGPIANLTLFGGFASTVCWPLSAYLESRFGWRDACLIYAALHLVVALPLFLLFPTGKASDRAGSPASATAKDRGASPLPHERLVIVLIALVMSLATGIGAIVIVELLIFLQARGVEFAAAVTLGMLFGPAQVGARAVESLFGRHYHPIWTMSVSCVLMFVGLLLLLVFFPLLAIAVIVYAGGYGISWIARGTLPLALFGPERYPVLTAGSPFRA
jgi:MFS family permease